MAGGEEAWLDGLNSKVPLPEKLQNLLPLCLDLAVKPWILKDGAKLVVFAWFCLNTNTFLANTQSTMLKGSNPWTKMELVEAIFIMAYFHSLCGPVYALGILPEVHYQQI